MTDFCLISMWLIKCKQISVTDYDSFLASTEAEHAEETTFSNSTFLSNCCADTIIYDVKICKTQAFSLWSQTFVPHCVYVLFTNTWMSLESLWLYSMKIINYKTNIFKGKSHLARRELISPNIKGRASLMCFHSLSPNTNSPHCTSMTQKQLHVFKF